MGKPTDAERKEALEAAAQMREQGNDPHYIAKTLLNMNYRMTHLEKVFHAAEMYMRGQGEQEHSVLLKAIEKAHREEEHTEGRDQGGFL